LKCEEQSLIRLASARSTKQNIIYITHGDNILLTGTGTK
jgi:hypothetical protein